MRKIIVKPGESLVVEKKSKFIGQVYTISNEEEALTYIEQAKKKYWDARHNCYAYVIDAAVPYKRYSDDGEPNQTAGKPMLDIIDSEHLYNILIIVTRYFGGILLGTGGLVRAYQLAARQAIENSSIAMVIEGVELIVETDYNDYGKIQHIAVNNEAALENITYSEVVSFSLITANENKEKIISMITEATNAKAVISDVNEINYIVVDGKVIII